MRYILLALSAFVATPVAADVTLTIGLGPADQLSTETYTCDNGAAVPVRYINTGANALALLPVGGEDRIFVNVVAGSGSRYVSGGHVWWVKGDGAMLEDTLEETTSNCTRD
ncbi:MliC family protein [Salipiger sp.]|uniref:MliC family protein n=1 Tax=Salipiger sp. TaxID=2078585 RepID=UPI003A96AEB5